MQYTEVSNIHTNQVSDWYDLWLNIHQMLTMIVKCWADNTRLTYNSTTRRTSNTKVRNSIVKTPT